MAENKEESNKNKDNFSFIDVLKTFVPLLGIFGVFCYVLGRSYIESYYNSLGMTADVLTFSTNDYMFFSITVVILCLFISLLFFLFWEFSQRSKGILFDETIFDKAKATDTRTKIKIFIFAAILLLLLIGSIAYLAVSSGNENIKNNGWVILCSVIILFLGLIIITDIIQCISSITWAKSLKDSNAFRVISAIFIGILIFLLTIAPIDILAKAQANNDELNFPDVRIICYDTFPVQIKSGTPEFTSYLDGQLITTNNGITYILKWFQISKDTDCKDIEISDVIVTAALGEVEEVIGDYKMCRLIYAIPVDSIKDIIYYSEK